MTPEQKLILAQASTAKGTYFDHMPLPEPGQVPLDPKILKEPYRQEIEQYTPDSKSRVNRNTNESELIRLYMKNKITTSQYNAALYLEMYYKRVMPSIVGGYGERITSHKTDDETVFQIDAQTILMNIADLMDDDYHTALRLLVLDNYHLAEISRRMVALGYRGWSKNLVKQRICGKEGREEGALLQLSRILPQAKRMKRTDRMVA